MTATERQIFEPDGRAVPYLDEGAGPVVVLLPAAGLDFAYLGTLGSILVEEDFRVIRIGTRTAQTDAVTLHDLAQDVVDVLTGLGVDDAWVGGHAFGGAVARTIALDHHDRVNGVLLLGVETGDAPADELTGSSPPSSVRASRRRPSSPPSRPRRWPPRRPTSGRPSPTARRCSSSRAPMTASPPPTTVPRCRRRRRAW
ncbi:alpha/beta fold hydrolase [Microbacterium aurum]